MLRAEEVRSILQLMSHAQWCPEVFRRLGQAMKLARCNTNYFHREPADYDPRADDVRSSSESALPCVVTEHQERCAPRRLRIFREQRATQRRTQAEHLEVISGN